MSPSASDVNFMPSSRDPASENIGPGVVLVVHRLHGQPLAALLTVTSTAVAVVVLPAASRATAASEWLPLTTAVVFQVIVYGAARTSAPRFAPSSLNCTPTTAMLSEAVADTVTV